MSTTLTSADGKTGFQSDTHKYELHSSSLEGCRRLSHTKNKPVNNLSAQIYIFSLHRRTFPTFLEGQTKDEDVDDEDQSEQLRQDVIAPARPSGQKIEGNLQGSQVNRI